MTDAFREATTRIDYESSPCPVCGGVNAKQIADGKTIRREMERVWAFHARRLRHPVPLSHLTDRVIFTQPPALTLLSCFECSHIFRNPREKPESVRSNYSNSKLGDDVYQSLFHNQEVTYRAQVRRLQAIVPTVHRGLEVGCYVGGFLAAARDAGLSFTGIDVNAEAAAFAAGMDFGPGFAQ